MELVREINLPIKGFDVTWHTSLTPRLDGGGSAYAALSMAFSSVTQCLRGEILATEPNA